MADKNNKLTNEELEEVSGGAFFSKKEEPTTFICKKCGRLIDLQGNRGVFEKYKANRFWCNRCGVAPPLEPGEKPLEAMSPFQGKGSGIK